MVGIEKNRRGIAKVDISENYRGQQKASESIESLLEVITDAIFDR